MEHPSEHSMHMGWGRFAAMIGISTILMFLLMYQLVYSLDHALLSVTRLVSALVMACAMTAVMLSFMWKMYRPNAAKIFVLAGAILAGLGILTMNRDQTLIGDESFMKAMIPHHSIAVNNARKADIRDPRVRYLADRITRDQVKEITEMKMLLYDIERKGRRANAPLPAAPATLKPDDRQEAEDLVSGELLKTQPL